MEEMKQQFSHTDNSGKARMVDISGKLPMHRVAKASGIIRLQEETIDLILQNQVKKGDVLGIARITGIQAAKMTPSIIPLCHPLLLSKVDVDASVVPGGVEVSATVSCIGNTGVEMEALTAVSAALLTIYDMCKAVDKQMMISEISLINKTKTELK